MAEPERWYLTHEGVEHALLIEDAGLGRRLTWTVGDEEVATKKTSEEKVTLDGGEHGVLGVRLPTFVGPARRVTWWGDEPDLPAMGAALLGRGGVDFDPEPGSKAAERESWIREHPRQYAVRRTAAAVGGVVVPIVLVWLLARFALPAIPWPAIPWPNVPWPSIPWPDWSIPWPSIPWPDWNLPDWSLPAWLRSLLDLLKYLWPVLLAAGLAQREVKRRREQDARKRAAVKPGTNPGAAPATEPDEDPTNEDDRA